MALPKAPDIPRPKPEDEDYMRLWHKYMQASQDNYALGRERDTWRRGFYTVAVMLFAVTVALLVLAGSKIMNYF